MTIFGVRCLFCLWLISGFSRVSWGQYAPPAADKIEYAQELEQESIQKKDSAILAKAYYQYGKAYNAVGNHLTAQQYYMKALRILTKRGDSYELGQVYMRLSDLECQQEHFKKCIEHGHTALDICKHIRSEKGMMIAYGCLNNGYSKIWMSQHNSNRQHFLWDTLWYYTLASKKLVYKLKDSLAMAEINLSIGNLYAHDHDRKALTYLQRAREIFKKKRKVFELSSTCITLANCHLSFGESTKAFDALQAGERAYRQIPNESLMDRNFLQAYMNYYQATNNPPKALEYSEKLRALEKKILLTDRQGAISRLNIEYETHTKDNQIKNQQNEIRLRTENESNQRIFLTISIGLLLLAVAASIAFYRLYRKNQRISYQNEELVKEQNHRVKNNLQVISSLLNLQARRLTDENVQKVMRESQLRIESMAILHRKLYEGERLGYVDLTEFIPELVENVQQTFGQVSVERLLEIEPIYLEADRATLIGLILTELLTNAWKYAFSKVAVPTLRINATHIANTIQIEVADNGPGWDKSQRNTKSLGMNIIKAQADQLHAEYQFEYENGTVFRLKFKN
jgi:two-component sensor histidine kinase